MVRLTDRPAMTIAVDLGRKATKPTNNLFTYFHMELLKLILYICLKVDLLTPVLFIYFHVELLKLILYICYTWTC